MRLHVAQLLRYLGFTLNDLEERTVVVQRSGPDWAYLTADMTAARRWPVRGVDRSIPAFSTWFACGSVLKLR